MKVDVKMASASVIKARLGIQARGPAHAFFTKSCFKYMGKFVPGGVKSHLNQGADLQVDSITYPGPSAHYLYNGKLYVDPKYQKGAFYSEDYGYWSRPGITKMPTGKDLKYHTPGTGAFWDKRMWSANKQDVLDEVQKYVERGCK